MQCTAFTTALTEKDIILTEKEKEKEKAMACDGVTGKNSLYSLRGESIHFEKLYIANWLANKDFII